MHNNEAWFRPQNMVVLVPRMCAYLLVFFFIYSFEWSKCHDSSPVNTEQRHAEQLALTQESSTNKP